MPQLDCFKLCKGTKDKDSQGLFYYCFWGCFVRKPLGGKTWWTML